MDSNTLLSTFYGASCATEVNAVNHLLPCRKDLIQPGSKNIGHTFLTECEESHAAVHIFVHSIVSTVHTCKANTLSVHNAI